MFHKLNHFICSHRLFQLIIGITFLLLSANLCVAQATDTAKSNGIQLQTVSPKVQAKYHSPRKAALLSTALPGLGQIYNQKYWKVPVIYAAFAGLAYSINFNQTKYIKYRNAYITSLDNTYTGPYSQDQLAILYKYYHRYRDLSVIGVCLLYVLNIADASVDAHLFSFDVDNNLSFNIHPTWITTADINHYTTGLSLSIKF